MDVAELIIEDAVAADLPAILALQHLCFQREAELHGDADIPALTQTLDELRAQHATHCLLVVRAAGDIGDIAGSVRGQLVGDTGHIGRLIVHPGLERRGLGARLLHAIEARLAAAARLELFTGHLSEGNLRFYRRHGYREIGRQAASPRIDLVCLEKRRANS